MESLEALPKWSPSSPHPLWCPEGNAEGLALWREGCPPGTGPGLGVPALALLLQGPLGWPSPPAGTVSAARNLETS